MASKLSLYNGANLILGERKLATTSENRPSRRRLDSVWDDGGVKFCLEQGLWNFAMNTISLTYSPSVTPPDGFPYRFAFDKPGDWCRTAQVADDGQFCNKHFDFADEASYWFANPDTIWIRYVSNLPTFGGDLSLWPEKFTQYVQHYFAWKIAKATTNSNTDKDLIEKDMKRLLNAARSVDAMNESPKFLPAGTWSRARHGYRGGRTDGGSSSSF